MKVKDMFGVLVSVPIAGASMQLVGDTFTGGLKGLGSATQSIIGLGVASNAAKLFKYK